MAKAKHETYQNQNSGEYWYTCSCGWMSNKFIPGSGETQKATEDDVRAHKKNPDKVEHAKWAVEEFKQENPDQPLPETWVYYGG